MYCYTKPNALTTWGGCTLTEYRQWQLNDLNEARAKANLSAVGLESLDSFPLQSNCFEATEGERKNSISSINFFANRANVSVAYLPIPGREWWTEVYLFSAANGDTLATIEGFDAALGWLRARGGTQ